MEPLQVVKLSPDAIVPEYMSSGASGLDVSSLISINIQPATWEVVPTGLAFKVPRDYEIQVRSRGGFASSGLIVLNQPGTLDSDYTGELIVLLLNVSKFPHYISIGDRIAQIVVCPVVRADLVLVNKLPITIRGDRSFGSTGIQ